MLILKRHRITILLQYFLHDRIELPASRTLKITVFGQHDTGVWVAFNILLYFHSFVGSFSGKMAVGNGGSNRQNGDQNKGFRVEKVFHGSTIECEL